MIRSLNTIDIISGLNFQATTGTLLAKNDVIGGDLRQGQASVEICRDAVELKGREGPGP